MTIEFDSILLTFCTSTDQNFEQSHRLCPPLPQGMGNVLGNIARIGEGEAQLGET